MMNELTYTKNGEYWIPDLTAAEQPMALSKYGRMRERFLKEHRTITYNNLLLSGKLTAHLMEIDQAAVNRMEDKVPVWEKANLSLEEAAAYFGIGINKLRDMTNDENCPFVLWNGSKRLIKRKALEKYLESSYSI